MHPLSLAAEFPNDNPELHRGAIWVTDSPAGRLVAEPVEERVVRMVEELVHELVDDASAPELSLDLSSEPERAAPVVAEAEEVSDDDDGEPIEIVDDLGDFDAGAPEPNDAFSIFARTLAEVAVGAGAADAVERIAEALASEATAGAWRSILNGESDDFAACGAKPLDEWAAELVARVVAAPTKADQLRRELRSRGVAAFGLVIATA